MMLEKMANVGFRGINRLSLPMTMRRIMGKALQHASRPEQAISVAMGAAARESGLMDFFPFQHSVRVEKGI